MKISVNGVLCALVLSTCVVGSLGQTTACADRRNNGDCQSDNSCIWGSTKTCKTVAQTPCGERDSTTCEHDNNCMFDLSTNPNICATVITGTGSLAMNQTCSTKLIANPEGDYWSDVSGSACGAGLMCTFANTYPDTSVGYDVAIPGTCASATCGGKKVPGNCNGKNDETKDGCSQATERVTICHRTCSAKNPWVRITIDNDAWNGTGCGHLREHDVSVECKNKAPWAEWGPNRRDHLIKWHGTRAQVAVGKTVPQIKAYWRKWEPACPYVRNGACCNWFITNPNDPDYNPCCGIQPGTVVPPTPVIEVKKYAGPVGKCAIDMFSGYEDNVYTVPTPTATSTWQYCYKVSVPSTSECIYQVKMTDSAPIGGITGTIDVTTPTNVPPGDNDDAAALCPNEVIYIPGKVVTGLSAPELGINAIVTGKGVSKNTPVTAQDPAGVTPNFVPSISIDKFAGPWGACPTTGLPGLPMQAAIYTTDQTKKFMYCYYIKNTGNECLLSAKMTDTAAVGGSTVNLPATFCPDATFLISGPLVSSVTGEPSVFASVAGRGQYTNRTVTATDDARVIVPEPTPVYAPNVTLYKYAGPPGSCPNGGVMLPSDPMKDDSYTTGADKTFIYCYYLKNTGNECLLNAKMTDNVPGGLVVDIPATFCPGNVIILPGSPTVSNSGEPCAFASLMGTGAESKITVTASDNACVLVPPPPPMPKPAVTISKYAGPPSAECPVSPGSPMEPVLYTTGADKAFMYCYYITNTGEECLNTVAMTDATANGGASETLSSPLCPGQVKIVKGPTSTANPQTPGSPFETCELAMVKATGAVSGGEVNASDGACVKVPYVPAVVISKFAGPQGACPVGGTTPPGGLMEPVLFNATSDKTYMYCYYIVNTGNECLLNALMTDPAVKGGLSVPLPEKFCPGAPIVIPGPPSTFEEGDVCYDASVKGMGEMSRQDAEASDGACVQIPGTPTPAPVTPAPVTSPTPAPETPAPVTESTPAPITPAPVTESTPAPVTPAPVTESTPAPITPAPVTESTPAPITPAPIMGPTPASVTPAPVTGPSPAPVAPTPVCVADMSNPGSSYCPSPGKANVAGVVLANVVGATSTSIVTKPEDMIYNIASADDGAAVSFKVNSPYPDDQMMYIQYHKVAPKGGWDKACFSQDTSVCSSTSEPLVAGCLHGDGNPFTLIQVYFVDNNPSHPFPGGAALEECCIGKGNTLPSTTVVAQYTFLLRCECPSMSRRLGGNTNKVDVQKMVSAFALLE